MKPTPRRKLAAQNRRWLYEATKLLSDMITTSVRLSHNIETSDPQVPYHIMLKEVERLNNLLAAAHLNQHRDIEKAQCTTSS